MIGDRTSRRSPTGRTALRSLGIGLGMLTIATGEAAAANEAEVTELRRMVLELRAQNQELSRRLTRLEGNQSAGKPAPAPRHQAAAASRPGPVPPVAVAPAAPPSPPPDPPAEPVRRRSAGSSDLEQRVRELELAQSAQEGATRFVIQDALNKLGPRINEFVSLSGSLEVLGGRFRDFTGPTTDELTLNTAELDLDIRLSEWANASFILTYNPGFDVQFPTTNGFNSGVDRMTVDRAVITLGDVQRFPLYIRAGQETLPFGTSTGVARLDTLSIVNPLTIEVFESRQVAAGIGFAFPTPELGPTPPGVVVPPARPLVITPLVERTARWMGFKPLPSRPARLVPVLPPPEPPPFYGSFQVYQGSSEMSPNRSLSQNLNVSLGYRTSGHCGRAYDELRDSWLCPWSFDIHADYNTSVFDSQFLNSNYFPYLASIGLIPGVALSAKAGFGPFSLVAELNAAIKQANFVDGAGIARRIAPMAWQVALGYQFDWNPWLESIGQQGTFVALGYSGSNDLQGVQSLIGGSLTRVGFVPQSRMFITAGEWVMDGVKLQIEYDVNWDYGRGKGGTGNVGMGIFSMLTFNF